MNYWFCGDATKQCFIKFEILLSEITPTSHCDTCETFRTNVNMTERTRAPLIVNHIIKYPDQSQGSLKCLCGLYPSHLHNTCSKYFSPLNNSIVFRLHAPKQIPWKWWIKVHNKRSRGHWIYWHSEDMRVTFDNNRSEAMKADAEPMRRPETVTSGWKWEDFTSRQWVPQLFMKVNTHLNLSCGLQHFRVK